MNLGESTSPSFMEHYTGPSKVNPPHLHWKNLPAHELQLQSATVAFSKLQDAAWLSQIHFSDKPVEWTGFNAQQNWLERSSVQKPKTCGVWSNDLLASCSSRHCSYCTCGSGKVSHYFWHVVHVQSCDGWYAALPVNVLSQVEWP